MPTRRRAGQQSKDWGRWGLDGLAARRLTRVALTMTPTGICDIFTVLVSRDSRTYMYIRVSQTEVAALPFGGQDMPAALSKSVIIFSNFRRAALVGGGRSNPFANLG